MSPGSYKCRQGVSSAHCFSSTLPLMLIPPDFHHNNVFQHHLSTSGGFIGQLSAFASGFFKIVRLNFQSIYCRYTYITCKYYKPFALKKCQCSGYPSRPSYHYHLKTSHNIDHWNLINTSRVVRDEAEALARIVYLGLGRLNYKCRQGGINVAREL